jgi:5-methylcytosine-specific restriction endonuclease McrA
VNQFLVQQVWLRAHHRCEYCRIPYPHYRLPFQVDHTIARQHGGAATLDNLAMAGPTVGRNTSDSTAPDLWA